MKLTMLATTSLVLTATLIAPQASGAIALDRTRVIFSGGEKSLSLNVSNQNKQLPYLAQGWIEDAQGKKIQTPLTVLPPVQRIEPGAKSQIKVQSLPVVNLLAQDRETLFYFNLREIPPRSKESNTLQIALQTRIKLFYRPEALMLTPAEMANPWQERLTLTKVGDKYQVNNPTPYFVTIVDGRKIPKGASAAGFMPVMIEPKGQVILSAGVDALGGKPVLTYVNDYGGRPQLQFSCSGNSCQASPVKDSK
uniref:fimbria/pilus periplasmic chaperone n=1 Tax=Serratia TaxID=613 RepID=UPI001F4BDB35|nr:MULTISPECIES: fimbria/pilus periplasmic chaperone [Serratia]ULG12122.1 molecular chaperone [Serratia entomophila]ULG12319.1 molecular chaperone [Serratia entomophila]ULG12359.1 molecular chaperone [Serratia entomophila]ULG15949.1 molecular chaperone [Serratia proteamaculans]ULG18453.1 molecular chaperone [Serratia proteamaculans]